MKKLSCLLFAVAIAAIAWNGYSSAATKSIDKYLTPPYESIIFGLRPEGMIKEESFIYLPHLKNNEMAGFHRSCDKKIHAAYLAEPVTRKVTYPSGAINLGVLNIEDAYPLTKELAIMNSAIHAAAMMSERAESAGVHVQVIEGTVAIATADTIMATASTSGGIETKRSEVGTSRVTVEQGLSISKESSSMAVEHKEQGYESIKEASGMQRQTQTQGARTETAQIGTVSQRTEAAASLETSQRTSRLAVYTQAMLLNSISDLDLSEVIDESDFKLGFYDEDGQLIDTDEYMVVPASEIDTFARSVCNPVTTASLLEKKDETAPSASLCESADVSPEIEIKLVISPEKLYYGHKAVIGFVITNIGSTPSNDLLILGGLPDNTAFFDFLGKEGFRSYFGFYAEKCKIIGLRLYRPLMPGESFTAFALLTLDPWIVE